MRDALIHQPVLVEEVVQALVTRPEGVYIDGTVGAAGHAKAILKHLSEKGRLIGIDRDPEILKRAREALEGFGKRILLLHGSYENLQEGCAAMGVDRVDGILLDLGVSSLQLGEPTRGFSFSKEGPLDMRMDPMEETTAAKIIATSVAERLTKIFRNFGEEPFAARIAQRIVQERRHRPIQTTTDLATLVERIIPRSAWPRRIHPATRVFQALRIAVNRELDRLDRFLQKAPDFLLSGGRLVILAYHSLEDRLVKQALVQWERQGPMRRVTKKPIRPSLRELAENPRARSVRMRVASKI